MINKSLVKKRFERSLKTYDDNAFIQKIMAKKLIEMLPDKNYNSILEAGCATGILTKEINNRLTFNEFYSNDIVEASQEYINKIIQNNIFLFGDIEEIEIDRNFDLIISNACLQWCNNIEKVIFRLTKHLTPNGILAFSIFGDNNLKEIKNIFNIENKTYSEQTLQNYLKNYNILSYNSEISKLYFNSPIDILKHQKYTGINALKEIKLTKTKLKEFETVYYNNYREKDKVKLTYNPVYIIIQN